MPYRLCAPSWCWPLALLVAAWACGAGARADEAVAGPRLAPEQLERYWNALKQSDDATAQETIKALVASPRDTVAFLKERLRPVKATPAEIEQWIKDLDAREAAVRERAAADLEYLGPVAKPALEKASIQTAEGRQQMQRLLGQLQATSPEQGLDRRGPVVINGAIFIGPAGANPEAMREFQARQQELIEKIMAEQRRSMEEQQKKIAEAIRNGGAVDAAALRRMTEEAQARQLRMAAALRQSMELRAKALEEQMNQARQANPAVPPVGIPFARVGRGLVPVGDAAEPEKTVSPAWRRAVRAVAVLEAIGTPEARAILENLSGGDEQAEPTDAAWAALERMARARLKR